MAVCLITDSASDLPQELEKQFDVTIVPLMVNFDEKEFYKDRFEISSDDFFKKLSENDLTPSTSQVNPDAFEKAFREAQERGDDIVGVFISSDLSGTYNSAILAREEMEEYKERIHLVDSRSVSFGQSLLVYEAGKMIEEGMAAGEVAERLETMKTKMKSVFLVDTLEYLKKGGRLSAGAAFIGGLLNLKPILTIEDGKLVPKDKVRGRKKAINWIKNWIEENGHDLNDKTLFFVHAAALDYMNELKASIEEAFHPKDILFTQVGAVVGTHSGPGAIGISFIDD